MSTLRYKCTDGSKTLHTLLIKYYKNCLDGQSRGRDRGGPAYLLVSKGRFYKAITEPIFKNFQENGALKKLSNFD